MNSISWNTKWLSSAIAIVLLLSGDEVFSSEELQCFSVEFFYDSSVDDAGELRSALEEFADERTGLRLHFRDVHQSEEVQSRIEAIVKHFKLPELKLPAIYGMKHIVPELASKEQLRNRLERILTFTAYVRNGCPHCEAAKSFLKKYESRYPALQIVYKEVITDRTARDEMNRLTQRYGQRAASLPVLHYCNGLTVGFDRDSTTGRRILQTLDYWSNKCAKQPNQ